MSSTTSLAPGARVGPYEVLALMFEMLTGRRAVKGTTPADTLSALLREAPTETIDSASTLAPGLVRVVRRCLEKAPEDVTGARRAPLPDVPAEVIGSFHRVQHLVRVP